METELEQTNFKPFVSRKSDRHVVWKGSIGHQDRLLAYHNALTTMNMLKMSLEDYDPGIVSLPGKWYHRDKSGNFVEAKNLIKRGRM